MEQQPCKGAGRLNLSPIMIEAGTIVVANYNITAGLGLAEVICKEGERLIVTGDSGNALHPIGVARESNPHERFAVSRPDVRTLS